MPLDLNPVEARILGVLVEKQLTTPDHYPLTLNTLVHACNQKTNRDPVMDLEVEAVQAALEPLRQSRLVWQVMTQGSRVPKYEHNFKDVADFTQRQLALLCALLLRGPQTPGELRSRTVRLTDFPVLAAVERTLHSLQGHESGPFVEELPRLPGQKECRYTHLLGEPVPVGDVPASDAADAAATPKPKPKSHSGCDRLAVLEKRVDDMAAELAELREQLRRLEALWA